MKITKAKKRIFKTASELFSEFGFLGISMGNIAKRLNITKPALYYHFKSKKELYLSVLENSSKNLFKTINRGVAQAETSEQKLSGLIQNYLYFGLKEKTLIKSCFLKTPELDSEIINYTANLRKKINKRFYTILKEISKDEHWKKEVDLKFTTLFLLGTMDRMILESTLFNRKLDIKKKSSQILEVINFNFRSVK